MEDELKSIQSELESTKYKVKQISQLRSRIEELEYADSKNQHIIQSLKSDKRRTANESSRPAGPGTNKPAGSDANSAKLERAAATAIKELKQMEAKYAELEERYLDLKLQD
jgi:hypothetical protein